MRNYDRSHPPRRYRITQLGNFPLWEANGRNDPKADSSVMMQTDKLAIEPATLPVNQSDTTLAAGPSATPIPAEDACISATKIPFRQRVENWLKRETLPYIRVDEAKRALFAGARLRSFHFVVYMAKTGPNWLVWAGPLNRECRVDMQQWESIFGDDFVAVIARPSRSNPRGFSLQTLAGQTVPYPAQEAESQTKLQSEARP